MRLLEDLSLIDAVGAAQQGELDIADDDEAGRALVRRLAAADPAAIAAAAEIPMTRLPVRYCHAAAFAPDLTEVAVLPGPGQPSQLDLYALPGGERVHRIALPSGAQQLVHLGDAVAFTEMYFTRRNRYWRVIRHRRRGSHPGAHWRREVLTEFTEEHPVHLGAVPGGFVVGRRHQFLAGASEGRLRESLVDDQRLTLRATHPGTGRLAVAIDPPDGYPYGPLTILAADHRVLAELPQHDEQAYAHYAWFCGPDRLVTSGIFQALGSYAIGDGTLVRNGWTHMPKYERQYADHMLPLGVTCLSTRDAIAVELEREAPRWYGARNVASIAAPLGFGDRFPIFVSAGEEYAGFEDATRTLAIGDLRRNRLLSRPLGQLTTVDSSGSELVRDCLSYLRTRVVGSGADPRQQ